MKRFSFLIVFTIALQSLVIVPVFSQASARSYYVRADGDDENDGRSEDSPLETLSKAFQLSAKGAVKKITVLGEIDRIKIDGSNEAEILITGKENASYSEKAVIKGGIFLDGKLNLKFENIEISGAERGLYISGGGNVVLGKGTKISDNSNGGVSIYSGGTLTIDGGEISNNGSSGIQLSESGSKCIMLSGLITGNNAGGVYMAPTYTGVTFEMKGGTISKNYSPSGGGVFVAQNGTFTMSGGDITDNSATEGGGGLYIGFGSVATVNSGTIQSNKAKYGAGVYVNTGSKTFTIINGTITKNEAAFVGGGVYVSSGGVFNQKGGKIIENIAGDGEGENIFKQQ